MQEEGKTLKQYCKEAMKRLKSGFWQNYHATLSDSIRRAEEQGISPSKVKEYYSQKISDDIKNETSSEEEFYLKVKKLLDEVGEVSDAIGRLTDKEIFNKLSYEEKQRYTLSLSERYVKALERYNEEAAINKAK